LGSGFAQVMHLSALPSRNPRPPRPHAKLKPVWRVKYFKNVLTIFLTSSLKNFWRNTNKAFFRGTLKKEGNLNWEFYIAAELKHCLIGLGWYGQASHEKTHKTQSQKTQSKKTQSRAQTETNNKRRQI